MTLQSTQLRADPGVGRGAGSGAVVRAVDRALDLLLLLGDGDRGVVEVAGALGVDKSTASRLLGTLLARGFASRDPLTGRFRPGPQLAALGHRYLERLRPERELGPVLARLADATGETVLLTILDRDQAVYADKVESRHLLRTHSRVGQRAPFHAGATGKCILAFLSPDEVTRLLGPGPFPRFTDNTIADLPTLLAQLDVVRQQGYAVSVEEIDAGVAGIGVPLLGWDRRPIGAISVTAPLARIDEAKQAQIIGALRQVADEWQQTVGAGPAAGGRGRPSADGRTGNGFEYLAKEGER